MLFSSTRWRARAPRDDLGYAAPRVTALPVACTILDGLVIVTQVRNSTLAEYRSPLDAVMDSRHFVPGMPVLLDLRLSTIPPAQEDDAPQSLGGLAGPRAPRHVAVLANHQRCQVAQRSLDLLIRGGVRASLFTDFDSAVDWLRAARG